MLNRMQSIHIKALDLTTPRVKTFYKIACEYTSLKTKDTFEALTGYLLLNYKSLLNQLK